MALYAVDFDGVLHDPDNRKAGYRMGVPVYHAREAMLALRRGGHRIVIHTHRANRDARHVADWLEYFNVPYDEITAMKPNADYFIDDHGVKFVSWDRLIPNLSDVTDDYEEKRRITDVRATEGRTWRISEDEQEPASEADRGDQGRGRLQRPKAAGQDPGASAAKRPQV